jgi:hypothetical protein
LGVGTVEEISGFAINKPALKEIVLPSNTDIAAGFHFKAPLISIGCAVEAHRHIHGCPALNVGLCKNVCNKENRKDG